MLPALSSFFFFRGRTFRYSLVMRVSMTRCSPVLAGARSAATVTRRAPECRTDVPVVPAVERPFPRLSGKVSFSRTFLLVALCRAVFKQQGVCVLRPLERVACLFFLLLRTMSRYWKKAGRGRRPLCSRARRGSRSRSNWLRLVSGGRSDRCPWSPWGVADAQTRTQLGPLVATPAAYSTEDWNPPGPPRKAENLIDSILVRSLSVNHFG